MYILFPSPNKVRGTEGGGTWPLQDIDIVSLRGFIAQ